jgi:hypothetical protein
VTSVFSAGFLPSALLKPRWTRRWSVFAPEIEWLVRLFEETPRERVLEDSGIARAQGVAVS